MTTNLYDDLAGRLDDLAAAFTDGVELTHPATADLEPPSTKWSGRPLVLVGIAAAVLAVIVIVNLRGGPDATTEVPVGPPEVPLADLLPDWTDLPPVVELTGPFADHDFSDQFDVSTMRQIDLDAGTVFVGLGPDGNEVVLAFAAPGGRGVQSSTGNSVVGLIGRGPAMWLGTGWPDGATVAGLAPRGAVAVSVGGHQAELKSGAFIASVDSGLLDSGDVVSSIEVEYEDGTTGTLPMAGVDGAPGGSATLSAVVEGTPLEVQVPSVGCARLDTDPLTFDIEGSAGEFDAGGADWFYFFLTSGNLNLQARIDEELVVTRVEADDLELQLTDSPSRADITWDTNESAGQLLINCGSVVIDRAELVELLRGP